MASCGSEAIFSPVMIGLKFLLLKPHIIVGLVKSLKMFCFLKYVLYSSVTPLYIYAQVYSMDPNSLILES